MISERGGHYVDFTRPRVKPFGCEGGAGGRESGAALGMRVEEGEEKTERVRGREVGAEMK